MDFTQLIETLRNPGEDPYEGNIYDDLSASYTEATSTRDAKIQVTGEELAAVQAELLAVKAMNYDLLIASGVGAPDPGEGNDPDADTVGDDDDFFEKKDD